MYLIKLALRPWRVAPWSQIFSALAVGFLLVIAGFLVWMERGLIPVVQRLKQEQVITAYLDPAVEPKDEAKVADEIRVRLGARAIDVKTVPAEKFVAELREHYPDLGRELENLGSEMNAMVPRYISASGIMSEDALEKVRTIKGIESADSSRDRYHHVVGAFMALRLVSRWLAAGLALALLTGLIHLARMNAEIHHDSIELLRLWGAGAIAIRSPGILSGALVGILGGTLAFGAWITAAHWLGGQVSALSPLLQGLAPPSILAGASLFACGTMAGLVAGIAGPRRRA